MSLYYYGIMCCLRPWESDMSLIAHAELTCTLPLRERGFSSFLAASFYLGACTYVMVGVSLFYVETDRTWFENFGWEVSNLYMPPVTVLLCERKPNSLLTLAMRSDDIDGPYKLYPLLRTYCSMRLAGGCILGLLLTLTLPTDKWFFAVFRDYSPTASCDSYWRAVSPAWNGVLFYIIIKIIFI